MTGIDISQWQSAIAPGAWDFIVCRATHDGLGDDLMFDQHFANALTRAPRRGAYHFAKPTVSSGAAQAQHFAQVCLAHGFRPGVDLWALDFEANALGSHAANVAWIREFMATATALLGGRRLLYEGWPYFEETCGAENVELLHESPWWLPAYGPNDGQPHAPTAPFVPCVHQFTSRGGPNLSGLDLNRVLDTATWARLVGTAPTPTPTPKVSPDMDVTPDSPIVSYLAMTGRGAWILLASGGILTMSGKFYGTPFGKPYWTGRRGARLIPNPNLVWRLRWPYVVQDTNGEIYGRKGF